jgi:RHS repeat-associated protein
MTARGTQTITWDVENRPLTVTGGATFVYDGDGNRVKKTEGGQTILYINQYYEKNLTSGVVTTYYYLGGQLVATREGTTLRYVHQDSLGSTSTMSASDGTSISSIAYLPFGATRTGTINTDKEFTGQRLDGTGLYYYNARYYDPQIGRFISPDSTGQRLDDPQTLNRYSYCLNNPLNRTDPTGHSSLAWLNMMYAGYMTGVINQELLPWVSFVGNGLNIGKALHEIAQVNAAQTITTSGLFEPAILENKMGNTNKRADITAAGQIWEVKPLNGESPEPQLRDYTALSGLQRGNNTILSEKKPIDISIIGNIRMEVTFGEDPGEIYYECYKSRDDGKRIPVSNWQILWEFEWRKELFEVGVACVVVAAIGAPEVVIPALLEAGAQTVENGY